MGAKRVVNMVIFLVCLVPALLLASVLGRAFRVAPER
jgi:hypothetical protein